MLVPDPESSPFVGRSRELARLAALSKSSRLVTVVGPSGIGKSRLALKYALTRRIDHLGGAFYCDLRDAGDVDAAIAVVMRAVGIDGRIEAHELVEAVARALAIRGDMLLVLDDIGPLLATISGVLERWLVAAPALRIIAANQRPLGLDIPSIEEQVLELGPLGVDGKGAEAVELAVARARALTPDWTPEAADVAALAEIARRVRGVPLAIELAASPTIGGDWSSVAARLASHVRWSDDVDVSTKRAIDRAWTLLDAESRELLCQASVFRGGIALEALEHVVQLGPGSRAVWDVAVELARRGLLEIRGVEPLRFAMAESIRGHAAEILDSNGRTEDVAFRHARYFDELVDHAADHTQERENFEAAVRFASSIARPELVVRLLVALDAVSLSQGLPPAKVTLLDDALKSGQVRDSRLIGRALGVRAVAMHARGRLEEAKFDASSSLAIAKPANDERQVLAMTRVLATTRAQLGELDEARAAFEQALAISRARGDRSAVAALLQQLGTVLQTLGRNEEARIHFENSVALAVEIDDGATEARASISLGSYFLEAGEHARARSFYDRGRELARRLRMARTDRIVLGYTGILCFDEGALMDAEVYLRRAAVACAEGGDLRVEGFFEGVRGATLAALGHPDEARKAFARAEASLAHNKFFADVIAIHRGHLDLAEARAAMFVADHLGARLHRDAAERRLERARAIIERSDDARIAVRILSRALSERASHAMQSRVFRR